MAQQLKVGGLEDLDYLNNLHMNVVIPFNQHSFKSLEKLKDSEEQLDISLSSKGTIINNVESVSFYKCKGRITELKRHTKGAEVIFELETPPEISTISF